MLQLDIAVGLAFLFLICFLATLWALHRSASKTSDLYLEISGLESQIETHVKTNKTDTIRITNLIHQEKFHLKQIDKQKKLIVLQTTKKLEIVEALERKLKVNAREVSNQNTVLVRDLASVRNQSARRLENINALAKTKDRVENELDQYKHDYSVMRDILLRMDDMNLVQQYNANALRTFISNSMRAYIVAELTINASGNLLADQANLEAGHNFCDALLVGSYGDVAVQHLFAVIGNSLADTKLTMPLPLMFDTAVSHEGTKVFMEQLGADYPKLHEYFKSPEYAAIYFMQIAGYIVKWFGYFPDRAHVEKILGNGPIATLKMSIGNYSGMIIIPLDSIGHRYKSGNDELSAVYKNIGLK